MSFNTETAGSGIPNLTLYAGDTLHSLPPNGRAPLRRIFHQDRNGWTRLFLHMGTWQRTTWKPWRVATRRSSSRCWARRRESQCLCCGLKIGVASDFCLVCSQTSTGWGPSWTKDPCCQAPCRMVRVYTLVSFVDAGDAIQAPVHTSPLNAILLLDVCI